MYRQSMLMRTDYRRQQRFRFVSSQKMVILIVMLQIAQQYIHFPENILQRITVNISRVMYDSSIVVYDKETQQLAIAPLNIGTPATDRDLCLLRYDANGGSGSMNLDQLEDSQLIDGEWYVHFNTATNGDGRLHANQFTAPEGKKFCRMEYRGGR